MLAQVFLHRFQSLQNTHKCVKILNNLIWRSLHLRNSLDKVNKCLTEIRGDERAAELIFQLGKVADYKGQRHEGLVLHDEMRWQQHFYKRVHGAFNAGENF